MTGRIAALSCAAAALGLLVLAPGAHAAQARSQASASGAPDSAQSGSAQRHAPPLFKPGQKETHGSVTVEGQRIAYDAYAGTLVVHPKGWSDVPQNQPRNTRSNPQTEASMFYVAYFKSGPNDASRPITFLYNGGPGSSSVWLHMGAFGPRRVVTLSHSQMPAAPYRLINNDYSLLDASDLVFIDAPGTGFSRIAGKNRAKAFYGIDQDAYAFADFITQFLSKYHRWNSPKYLFGESYGTTRSAVLINLLETDWDTNFNGVIMLSQILNFDNSIDAPETNPGIDLPYELGLPTFAATAWYHHLLPGPRLPLQTLLKQVEQFAMNEYAHALQAGWTLPATERNAVAQKLHQYTGLSVSYIEKANLRINGLEFEKTLEDRSDESTGRLDTRFTGPTLDPLSEDAQYDPQAAAISSAYVATFNDYVRQQLKFGQNMRYKPEINIPHWDFLHQPPTEGQPIPQSPNVMIDLAMAMKYDPDLHVMLNCGYFDLATPFFEGVYEMHHLPIPPRLGKNIQIDFYRSGHMVYVRQASLKQLHDNVAAFIRGAEGGAQAVTKP